MSTPTQNRISKGVTEGGQFATSALAEADVSLQAPQAPDELSADDLMVEALAAARYHSRVKGLRFTSPDDIAQSTIETVLSARANNPTRVVTKAYVSQVAWGHVAIVLRGNLSARDRKAIGMYEKQVTDLESELGRPMTPVEKDALADQIRDDWHDQRRKPSKNFVELAARRTYSLDAPAGSEDGGTALGDVLELEAGDSAGALDPDSLAGHAYQVATQYRKSRAAKFAWAAFAEQRGLPAVKENRFTQGSARALKGLMADAGGVGAALRDFDSGLDTEVMDALFAPFGVTDGTQREDLVDALSDHRDYAEHLWAAAVSEATGQSGTAAAKEARQTLRANAVSRGTTVARNPAGQGAG